VKLLNRTWKYSAWWFANFRIATVLLRYNTNPRWIVREVEKRQCDETTLCSAKRNKLRNFKFTFNHTTKVSRWQITYMKRLESDGCEDYCGQSDSIDARWRHGIKIVARKLRCKRRRRRRWQSELSIVSAGGLRTLWLAKPSNHNARRENAERDVLRVPRIRKRVPAWRHTHTFVTRRWNAELRGVNELARRDISCAIASLQAVMRDYRSHCAPQESVFYISIKRVGIWNLILIYMEKIL